MNKLSNYLLKIFAIGVLGCLFAGGLSFLGYLVALFIGGEAATALCAFVFKQYLPWVIRFTSIFAGIGLVGMYLSRQKALTVDPNNEQNKK